ncbi:ABC transporter ATP-binding protein [Liquorilactobacillus satsumensis]|uniref:ABC-type quaternary amine transporter n=2 Tax=Liquorilactobacillus satsumensis TaxID=259059 RepID=A0A0R1UUW8_9LACO|nr:ABC transporter ATP-binding protein [Liquorilactobacillus satsumensis]KRL96957.1 ABC superfamily ATP binding cassette transporter, ABC protein [Liquorilactobacillus satsumensis DSM 16230 = JCM 12392]MCC7667140.1 ABC transporter ATP-binding protein [Liquorilactobacillus satsumensis]MCP9312476.1 ABC transporter ATP-binding protein [Liquorilactobacillus satsumensis]MCP9329063.1 ABC transporter ATP-binding protein [Liquorilactobacillus satsumensis]MCP9357733.1 ABC transporter ATP-binding protei
MDNLVNVEDLSINFGKLNVISEMNFNIKQGTLTSILGPSGGGKTTVLRAIAGLNQNITGKILLDGQDITHLPANKRNIGMIFQSYALFPNLSVSENIAYGLKVQKKPQAEINAAVNEMLALVGMEQKKDTYPDDLSGGQKQRVAIARAMVMEPKLLLLDEPFSALDAKIRVELRNQIKHYQEKLGITMIFVTHDQAEAIAISDDIIVMNDGQVQQQGSPMEIYAAPQNLFVANFIGNHNILSGQELVKLGLKNVQGTLKYVVRPELFERAENHLQSSDSVAITGTVQSASILGDRVQYLFESAPGIMLKVENLNHAKPLTVGAKETLYLHSKYVKEVGA